MSKREKRLEKARNNPKNVTYDDLIALIESYGFVRAHGEGSHSTFIYKKDDLTLIIGIVYRKPQVKPAYVLDAIEKIDQVRAYTGE